MGHVWRPAPRGCPDSWSSDWAPDRARVSRVRAAALALAAPYSALSAWSEPAALIDDSEVLRLAELYEAAAPALDSHEAAQLRCQVDAERYRHEAREPTLRDLVRNRLLTVDANRIVISQKALQARIDDAADPITEADVSASIRSGDSRIRWSRSPRGFATTWNAKRSNRPVHRRTATWSAATR